MQKRNKSSPSVLNNAKTNSGSDSNASNGFSGSNGNSGYNVTHAGGSFTKNALSSI
ncbi:MAG: hypothetical protein Q8N57_02125 [bacterium]|nr:hypothetical protein [bacterium]